MKKILSKPVFKAPDSTIIFKILQEYYGELSCPLNYKKPYELVIAVILSAQCTDNRVNTVTPELFKKFPELEDYANADLSEIEKYIYSTGFYKNKSKSIQGFAKKILQDYNGKIPSTIKELTGLPGIGRKTANVVLNEIFEISEGIVVDTHVKRVSKRLGFTNFTDPVKIEKELMNSIPKEFWKNLSLYFVFLGREFCKANKKLCENCPLNKICPSSELGEKNEY
ncbi:MAG: endonuclease III [Leptospiraceae bacterium]|nr:endonuclease III [Leptospiraceae bacterium]